jgi:uncharacterized protein YcbK (DUF882 family)
MNLSEHFTLAEFLKSDTVKKFNAELEPLRTAVNMPIIVTSGYRSNALNVAMHKNGCYTSKTSQHMKGESK